MSGGAVGILDVDLEVGGLGLPPHLDADLGGRTVLARTVAALRATPGLDEVVVACPPAQLERLRALLAGQRCQIVGDELPDVPHRQRLRKSRAWAARGWRGGWGDRYAADEEGRPRLWQLVLETHHARTAVVVSPAAPLLDPALAGRMLEAFQRLPDDRLLNLPNAPPGLAPAIYDRRTVDVLVEHSGTVCNLMRWDALDTGEGQRHLLLNLVAIMPLELAQERLRFQTDSRRQLDFVRRVWAELGSRGQPGHEGLDWRRTLAAAGAVSGPDDAFPWELEIELTHRRPVPRDLRPAAAREGDLAPEALARILGDLEGQDDVLLTLGRLGDPLCHPDLDAILEVVRAAGLHAMHLNTWGLDLDEARAAGLREAGVDVVSVRLDAATAATYERAKGLNGFERASAALALLDGQRGPDGLAEMMTCPDNHAEMADFYERQFRERHWCVVRGFQDGLGAVEDRAVVQLQRSRRSPCLRLGERLSIDATGVAHLCDQDVLGRWPLGSVLEQGLGAIWRSAARRDRWDAHRRGDYAAPCDRCQAWCSL